MKRVITFLACLASLTAFGQSDKVAFDGAHWNAPYTLAIPFGWNVERSSIQKEFAPQVPFSGIEDIRYTPGWGNSKSEQYWSYGFLWYLNGSPAISKEMIGENLTAYYTESFNANTDTQNIPMQKKLSVKTSITERVRENGDLKTYYGTVAMLDYPNQKPISLNCIVHVKSSSEQDKTFLFFEVSPQPLNSQIWKSLDQLWLNFDCTASEHKPRLTMNAYFHSESAVGGGQ